MDRITISITGLPNAGKTSFTQRLLTGSFIETQPTIGVDVEFTDYRGFPLQIWDMGGHMAFRQHIWENYIRQSSALIFIFDASDSSKIEESSDWFWKSLSWIDKEGIPVLFLANKWDLVTNKDSVLDEIVTGFELNKLASIDSRISFRFYFISVKSGAYISDAMKWLIIKNFMEKNKITFQIDSFDIFINSDVFIAHLHDNSENRMEVEDLIIPYKRRWIESDVMNINIMEEISFQNYKVFFLSHQRVGILIITQEEIIDRSIFSKFLNKLDTSRIYNDKEEIYVLFEQVKKLLSNQFFSEIASSLSCEITEVDIEENKKQLNI